MSRRNRTKKILKLNNIIKRIQALIKTPLFWMITFFGNACICLGAFLFHMLEADVNPNLLGFIDSLSWAVSIVTTVGSSLSPITLSGKILEIFMMMGGALFLWSYMALFVGALVEPELRSIEREVAEIQEEMKDVLSEHKSELLREETKNPLLRQNNTVISKEDTISLKK